MKKGMCKVEEPLLFIPTPPFYYVEINDVKEATNTIIDESTSVYEISRAERITNPVIAKQLQYFAHTTRGKSSRYLVFHLKNDEKLIGLIEGMDGTNVKVKTFQQVQIINGNDIQSISFSSKGI